jgi:dipeptidyl aminopeptidase/acylaminoacyl peptidase
MKHSLLCSTFLLLSVTSGMAADGFTAEDLLRSRRVAAAAISPRGDWVAYTVESMREPSSKPGPANLELYLVSTRSGEARPYVTGEVRLSGVAWRPDGSAISYVAKRHTNKHTQVWMIPAGGGESTCITGSHTAVVSYRWSPDGTQLAYIAADPPSTREEALNDAGYGFTFYEENLKDRTLYLVDVDAEGIAGESRRLTDGISVWSLAFSPDGRTIAIGASERNLVDQEYMFQNIYLVDAATGSRRVIVAQPNKIGNYAFSPDGSHLAFNGALERRDHKASQVYVVPVTGGESRNLTIPDFRGHVNWVGWKDRGTLLYKAGEGVETTLSEVPVKGGERRVVLSSEQTGVVFDDLTFADGKGLAACVGQSPKSPGEVYVWKEKEFRRITDVNPWFTGKVLGKQEVVRYQARDGKQIEGLLILPVNHKGDVKYPLVVVVHGGPESHYSNGWLTTYSAPAQVLAGKGYAVFFPNYRSSTGYGTVFALQGYGDPAGKEFDDIADGIDYLIDRGIADRERVGLGGGSYGGYASGWFATYYTKYVRAVCMFVGVSDLISMGGTSDIPWEHIYVHWGQKISSAWEKALQRSPIYHAEKSRTATLIMGGLADTRVSPSQSLELFRIMKLNDHPAVRLVQYPGEGHGNSRQPGRIDVLYRTLAWYDWYVKEAKPVDGEMPPLDISPRYGIDLPGSEATAPVSSAP